MPSGYLVTLGDNNLDTGDVISGSNVSFVADAAYPSGLGTGQWIWTGTASGSNYTDELEPGVYWLANDGNVYFVPDYGPVDTLSAASVTTAPEYSAASDGTVSGTSAADVIDSSYTDPDGNIVDGGDGPGTSGNEDVISAGSGNDTVLAGLESDIVYGGDGHDTVDGGDGDDVIYGDAVGATDVDGPEFLDWAAQGSDEDDLSNGFTQNTGGMDVSVSFSDDGNNNPTLSVESTLTTYVDTGEPFDPLSNSQLSASGGGATATVTIDYSAASGSGLSDEVQNVRFRLNDIDKGDESWVDVITINAFDALGSQVSVTITEARNDTVSGNTITAGGGEESGSDDADEADGSALIEISGPLSQIDIIYSNGGSNGQHLYISDIHFDTIIGVTSGEDALTGGAGDDEIYGEAGNDTLSGGTGEDTLDGGEGADTLTGGQDNDTMTGGAGNDVFSFADGSGDDVITDFDTSESTPGGAFNDQLDVSNLTDTEGNPVDAWDVAVSDDGSGNARLTFPNGESIVLHGVGPSEMTGAAALNKAGIPCLSKGTLIETPQGERPIEELQIGDMICTLDNGPEPLVWIGQRRFCARDLELNPRLKPVRIAPGVLGNHSDLFASPLHGMLTCAPHQPKGALARAKHLVECHQGIRVALGKRQVHYYHLLFRSHQIIRANGAWSESLYPGPYSLAMFEPAQRAEIYRLFPDLLRLPTAAAYGQTTRKLLKLREMKDNLVKCA